MANKDPYAPQKRYREKLENSGLVRISAFVPEDDREKALNYCAQLRKKQRNEKEGA